MAQQEILVCANAITFLTELLQSPNEPDRRARGEQAARNARVAADSVKELANALGSAEAILLSNSAEKLAASAGRIVANL